MSRSTHCFPPFGLPGLSYQVALRVLIRELVGDCFDINSEQLSVR